MSQHETRAIFVTGTDTDVGKTVVSSWIVHHWNAHYWKPIQSGLSDPTDSETITQLSQIDPQRVFPETYRLNQPLSPHASAAIDGIEIHLEQFQLPTVPHDARLVVEGAGGILVPINDDQMVIDIMQKIGLPVLVVARSGLGTLNHTLLTLAALRNRNFKIAGVVMVGQVNDSNREALEHYGQTTVLAELPRFETLNHQSLAQFPLPKKLHQYLESI